MIPLLVALLLASPGATSLGAVRSGSGAARGGDVTSGPLFLDDANTVAHVRWNGSAIVDLMGNAWAMTGTVPQVARSGKTPPSSGPYAAANYYTNGAGAEGLDFAGDFTVCIAWIADGSTTEQVLLANQDATTGWAVEGEGATRRFSFARRGCASAATVLSNLPLTSLNVGCAGRAANSWLAKLNLGTTATNSCGTYAGNCTTGANCRAALGVYLPGTLVPQLGKLVEVWATTTTAAEAAFIAYMTTAKTRGGITAW
jgi:hypothetical protein